MPVDTNLDPHHALPPAPQGSATITDPAHMLPEHSTPAPGKSKGSPTRMIIVLLLIAAAVAFVVWRIRTNNSNTQQENRRSAAAANRPTPVQVADVQQKTVPVYLTALGTVTAYNTVTLHTRVDGQLLQVNFREGQAVRKGQLLLEIDPRPYQAAVDQAVGTLAKDEANLKNTEAEAQRYNSLYEAGVVSKEQQQLQVSNAGQAAGTIKADQAAIEAARVNLGYTHIYSPIDGVVGLRQVDPGNIVHASDSTGLVVITQIHPIAIVFTLPEDQLPQVQQAMKGGNKLVVEAYDRTDAHKIAAGTLLTIDNQIDTTTGTAKLKAVFDNGDNSLFPNQFVNIRLVLRQRPNAIVIPTAAIQSGNQGNFVFVVNSGPTPPDKLKNLPGATTAAGVNDNSSGGSSSGSTSSGKHKHGGSSQSADNTANTADNSDNGGGGKGSSQGTHAQSCPAGPNHADSVNVHVDFALGTDTVLAAGALQPGQKVVVDGAEKLVDGGNVCPQAAKSRNGASATAPGTAGAGSAAPPSPDQQPAGVNNGTPQPAGRNGQGSNNGNSTPGSTTPGNGGGNQ